MALHPSDQFEVRRKLDDCRNFPIEHREQYEHHLRSMKRKLERIRSEPHSWRDLYHPTLQIRALENFMRQAFKERRNILLNALAEGYGFHKGYDRQDEFLGCTVWVWTLVEFQRMKTLVLEVPDEPEMKGVILTSDRQERASGL